MLVKCRKCANKIDRNNAFKVVVGNKNVYYCNETEYLEHLKEKEFRENIYDSITRIFGYLPKNTALYKEMNELFSCFKHELIDNYLKEKEDYLYDIIRGKDFSSEYAKIRYFSAILKNTLVDFQDSHMKKTEESIKPYVVDDIKIKYNRKQKRRGINEIENDIEDGDTL